MAFSLTIDVENYSDDQSSDRYTTAISPLISALKERGIPATFFIVGEIAENWSNEIRALKEGGHEIGLHGYSHRLLNELGPDRFKEELAHGMGLLTEILGEPPKGFRAPYFSITPDTPWAPDAIAAAGFAYSSSVLPAINPQAGLPNAPRQPFRWPNGLVEFPTPVFGIRKWSLPILGGAYLRLAPQLLVKLASWAGEKRALCWTYAHPYDFDVEEPFRRREGESYLFGRLLFARRSLMLERVLSMASSESMTLGELATDYSLVESLPFADPFGKGS